MCFEDLRMPEKSNNVTVEAVRESIEAVRVSIEVARVPVDALSELL
jgi:hypothetical protein